MSGFLAGLVGRARGEAAGVRPRVPYRGENVFTEELAEGVGAPEPAQPHAIAQGPETSVQAQRIAGEAPPLPAPPTEPTGPELVTTPSRPHPSSERPSVAPTPTPIFASERTPAASQPEPSKTIRIPNEPLAAEPIGASREEARLNASAQPGQEPIAARVEPREAVTPSGPASPQPSRRAASELAPAELVAAADKPEAVAPVVKITIGRLDVRAPSAPAPAPPSTPAPQPKRLTLDDYLAQRNGGDR